MPPHWLQFTHLHLSSLHALPHFGYRVAAALFAVGGAGISYTLPEPQNVIVFLGSVGLGIGVGVGSGVAAYLKRTAAARVEVIKERAEAEAAATKKLAEAEAEAFRLHEAAHKDSALDKLDQMKARIAELNDRMAEMKAASDATEAQLQREREAQLDWARMILETKGHIKGQPPEAGKGANP